MSYYQPHATPSTRLHRTAGHPRALSVLLCALTATLLLMGLAVTSSAQAESPWWHLTSGSRPAYLHPGVSPGVDEVQELKIEEETARIVGPKLTQHEIEEEEYITKPESFAQVTKTMTAAEIQQGLEKTEIYGPGNVHVTGGPETYTVTFVGALAERPVALMRQAFSGQASITETTAGSLSTDGELYMTAENVGDANVQGAEATVKFTDVLPKGLKAVGVAATEPFKQGDFEAREPIPCSLEETGGVQIATCTLSKALVPYDQLEMRIAVQIQPGGHSGEQNEVSISGGGAQPVSVKRPITISTAPVPFGVESYEMALEEEGGAPTSQAGAHPFQLNTTIALNQLQDIDPLVDSTHSFRPEVTPPALAKDLNVKLPRGLIGNPTSIAQCTTRQFFEAIESKENRCPAASAVGVATVTVHEPANVGTSTLTEPVFNLEPRRGEPARFGFYAVLANSPVFIDTSVRTGEDYGVTVNVQNITQTAALLFSEVTFWGVPGDPRHDNQRGWGCLLQARESTPHLPCNASEEQHPKPLLSLPTACSQTPATSVQGDSWASPGSFFDPFPGQFEPGQLSGCNRLQFAPEVKVTPDHEEAGKPTGLKVDVHVPQQANSNAQGLASSNVKDITVKFPQGVVLNPSAANGLAACSEGEVGFLHAHGAAEELLFTPTLPEPFCPDAAKLGTVKIKTPLLPPAQPIEEGGLYLASPQNDSSGPEQNPFSSLVAMYIVVKDPISGVLVKLPGSVSLDSNTGQITSTFLNNPDLTFEDAEVHLYGGERAPLATPTHCGTYTTEATFTPWSGTAPVKSSSSFNITSGPHASPCPSAPLPFSPTLSAGTTNINAGAFSALSTTISRQDTDQAIQSVQLHMPPGLSGVLTGVTLCTEAQAGAGACPENSLIGHSTVSVGLGSEPFTAPEGKVYLTESYKGAPFGLAIVNPAVAGPFDLGTVTVRAKLEVDPHTAALSATTDESGPYAIPRILHGIPLQIRHANVTIDRQNFTFDPTSCNPQVITATATGYEGASAALSSPFQAANCQNLKFAPKFAVTTSAKATKANGTSLNVKLTYPSAPPGTYANVAKVRVFLPKQLPSRLTTLNKACTSAVFEANPANCPKESIVGQAKVLTPLLPVPLMGNAYFVSHGGEAFPDLTLVLKGYGVTVDLVGNTQIKKGITISTFKATPDVPFSSFELNLPAQKFSALTANANLCASKLTMPTEFQAQNGAEIHQNTPISVTGCAKTLTRAQQLAKALKACHKKHAKAKRQACERQAHKRYGATAAKKRRGK